MSARPPPARYRDRGRTAAPLAGASRDRCASREADAVAGPAFTAIWLGARRFAIRPRMERGRSATNIRGHGAATRVRKTPNLARFPAGSARNRIRRFAACGTGRGPTAFDGTVAAWPASRFPFVRSGCATIRDRRPAVMQRFFRGPAGSAAPRTARLSPWPLASEAGTVLWCAAESSCALHGVSESAAASQPGGGVAVAHPRFGRPNCAPEPLRRFAVIDVPSANAAAAVFRREGSAR